VKNIMKNKNDYENENYPIFQLKIDEIGFENWREFKLYPMIK